MTDLERYGSCTLADDGCTTCGDVAVPVRVVRRAGECAVLCEDRTGRRAVVMTDFTPSAGPGDVLLIHSGVSIARIEPSHDDGAST